MAHLTQVFIERSEYTFGERKRRSTDVIVHGDVVSARADLVDAVEAWRTGVSSVSDDRFMDIGLSQATEVDAGSPFGHVVMHTNRELIHHGAEIFALTDLWRTSGRGS